MFPRILKVYLDDTEKKSIDVPVTPSSTFEDVLNCVKEPGNENCHITELWNGCERPVREDEKPIDVLQQWGEHREDIKFHLKYQPPSTFIHTCGIDNQDEDGRKTRKRCGGKEGGISPTPFLPAGVDLTLSELQDMATRQQQQIEGQQQALVAKEQRLKFLKQQEMKHQHISSENERLRKLREKVESQELKLKKLRAVRGQVEQHKQSNGNLNAELESIRSLFNEKEKELAMAVTKVDELTRQLEEIRKGKLNGFNGDMSNSAAAIELDKLKKELLARNKLNDEENSKLLVQRRVLRERKDAAANMDNRIQELQQRLKKKKLQQAEAQNKLSNQKVINFNKENDKLANRSNVAAVEPYIQHPPHRLHEQENLKNQIDSYNSKHQLVQNNLKISDMEKDMYNEKPQGKVQSNVNKHSSVTTSERAEDYKVPLVVSVDATDKNKQDPQDRSPVNRENIKPPPPCGPQSSSAPVKFPSYPNSRTTIGNMANFVPRPFGSTYGTSHLGRNLNSAPNLHQQPNINIQEERQAGSGQSSPASSESSHSSLTQKVSPREVVGGNFPLSGEDSLKYNDNSAISNKNNWNNQISAPPVPVRVPFSSGKFVAPNQTPTTVTNNVAPGNVAFSHPVTKPAPQNSIPVSQGTTTVTPVSSQSHQSNFSNSHPQAPEPYPPKHSLNQQYSDPTSHPNRTAEKSEPQQEHNQNNQSNGTKSTSNQKPRYAPKSVIENTYMRKLGNDTLQKYQKNIGLLYKSLSSNECPKPPSELPVQSNIPNQTIQPPDSQHQGNTGTNNSPSSPRHGHPHHFPQSASPNHPDIASDKVSYKMNTPKYIRRRHSDSENEDLTRLLKPHEKYDYPPQYQNVTNNSNTVTDPSLFESQVTSFSTPTPEKVSLDNLGNIVELEVRDSSDQGSSSSSSQEDLKQSTVIIETNSTDAVVRRKKTNLKKDNSRRSSNRVSFDPLALLLDASLEGELELVKRTASEVPNVSASNDEGISALHNAICAGHIEIVQYLVEFGCDVNAPDSDGWTPLHCAASCNNLPMVKFLVEHGACIFATTISDQETAAEKCEEDEDGYDGCFEYLYSIQQKLGIMNNGIVYAVFDYSAMNSDELSFKINEKVMILRKGDENEKEWWWSKMEDEEGYVPRNLFGLSPRVLQEQDKDS